MTKLQKKDIDISQPLDEQVAKKLMVAILNEGRFEYSSHAEKELKEDDLTIVDAVNVIRGGVVEPAEFENGEWRYRVRTSRMVRCRRLQFC
jgi:hypothetical protein